jgi:ABC-type iron transport system FetAB ATPase subunit
MYVPAESQWWRETVREHLNELPDTEFLNQFGFDNDVLDWEIGRLSSGEKQKLALLRAFLLKPEALLLDEPTSSLDKGSVKKVEALIDKYVKNNRAATIWVSHDQDQINRASDSHFEIQAGGNMRQLK